MFCWRLCGCKTIKINTVEKAEFPIEIHSHLFIGHCDWDRMKYRI